MINRTVSSCPPSSPTQKPASNRSIARTQILRGIDDITVYISVNILTNCRLIKISLKKITIMETRDCLKMS